MYTLIHTPLAAAVRRVWGQLHSELLSVDPTARGAQCSLLVQYYYTTRVTFASCAVLLVRGMMRIPCKELYVTQPGLPICVCWCVCVWGGGVYECDTLCIHAPFWSRCLLWQVSGSNDSVERITDVGRGANDTMCDAERGLPCLEGLLEGPLPPRAKVCAQSWALWVFFNVFNNKK